MTSQILKMHIFATALLFSAGQLVANECSGDANSCTPKQLCAAATTSNNGQKVWSSEPELSAYVETAKSIGIDCGVVEVIASCENDPELCSITELCQNATRKKNGKTVWNTDSNAAGYINLANEYNLNCDVSEIRTESPKNCLDNASTCNDISLCYTSVIYFGSKYIWARDLHPAHVNEAQRRRLNCPDIRNEKQTYAHKSSSLVVTEKQAEVRYAATGIWIKSPALSSINRTSEPKIIIPKINDRITNLKQAAALQKSDNAIEDTAPYQVSNVPRFGQTFRLNSQGLVIATANGSLSQEGHLVFLGSPRKVAPGRLINTANACVGCPKMFESIDPPFCWIEISPVTSLAKKNNRIVIVKRGEVRLIVASKPALSAFTETNQETAQELLFSLGYPARQHSVEIETDTTSMSSFKTTLVSINDIARPKNSFDNANLLRAFKKTREIEVTAMSSRGTVTEDTFSTYGFTYLIDKISRECGQAKTSFIKKKWPVFPIAPTPTPKNMNVNSAIAAITESLAPKLRAKTVDQSSFRIKSIQQQLNRVGCNVGVADGVIGEKTRSGLYRFTMAVQIEYDIGLLKDENFLELVKNYPLNTCSNVSTSTNSNTQKRSSPITATRSNSAELQRLQQERQILATNLQAMQEMMDRQDRMANAAYNSCFSRCALNNRAGSGIMGALGGMAQCNMSCAPLKYGGAATPPSWERDKRRYQRVDCMITRMSKNQTTASCNQY